MGTGSIRRWVLKSAVGLVGLGLLPGGFAQEYPVRPVRVIVTSAPGGSADKLSRLLFSKLSEDFGQQFVIEHRPGGGGTIGPALVAQAPADGYTVMFDSTVFAVNPALRSNLAYDTFKDFKPLFLVGRIPLLLVMHPSVPAKSVADIIEIAKAAPDGIAWASPGVGSIQHMMLEMVAKQANVKLNHVAYKGGGPALVDLMAGHVKFYFSNTVASTPYVKSGAIRAVAQTTTGRIEAFPDLPPVSDTLPGFAGADWLGVFLRSGTPPAVVSKLSAGLNKTLLDPGIKKQLVDLTVEFGQNTPEEFEAFVKSEAQKWGQVVRDANIRLD